jgi:hypothetical protein
MAPAVPHCFRLLPHREELAVSFATFKAGSSIAAKIPMIAITTSNSTKVNFD